MDVGSRILGRSGSSLTFGPATFNCHDQTLVLLTFFVSLIWKAKHHLCFHDRAVWVHTPPRLYYSSFCRLSQSSPLCSRDFTRSLIPPKRLGRELLKTTCLLDGKVKKGWRHGQCLRLGSYILWLLVDSVVIKVPVWL